MTDTDRTLIEAVKAADRDSSAINERNELYRTAAPQLVEIVERLERERDWAREIARRWHEESDCRELYLGGNIKQHGDDGKVITSWPAKGAS